MSTVPPPPRAAPPPPGPTASADGIEDAVAQLRAALEKDPSGFTTDESARAILDKLNEEIAKIYGEEDDDGEDGGADEDFDEDEESEYTDDEVDGVDRPAADPARAASSPSVSKAGSSGSLPRVELPKGPRPYDLWKAAHELDRPAKEKLILTTNEWSGLVKRLNDSSKQKQAFLMRAQHQQIAAELSGLTFTPSISERSRELASHNKSLPDRMDALARKKRAKLERIKHDRVAKEMAEATFKPDLEKSRKSARKAGLSTALGHAERGHIVQLMQYEMDKKIRAAQRRQLIQELEDRELTFTPAINRNSVRIVQRLNTERESRDRSGWTGTGEGGAKAEGSTSPGGPTASRAATKALTAALAAGVPLATAAAVTGVPIPTDTRVLKTLGRSFLPGHEEETFHPRINPRSAALHRPGLDDKDVYSRLYQQSTSSRQTKVRSKSPLARIYAAAVAAQQAATGASGGAGGVSDSGSVGSKEGATSYPVDEDGEPAPGHPLYFNVIAYEPTGRLDFLLRRFAPATTAGAAFSAPLGGIAE